MNQITFEQLPSEVGKLSSKLERIEQLLLNQIDQSTTPEKDLMTIKEASAFLTISVPTIYSKVSRKELPYMKQGKRLYFSKTELMTYLKKGRNATNAEVIENAHENLHPKK